jgi:ATP-independent RNA helicase DbpA
MTIQNSTATALSFSSLSLSPQMLENLERLGYTSMTAIQAASLPVALLGKDLIAQAKTGSGKTAAFALALLANINPRWFAVQAMVLCPTRELADQVTTELRRLARAEENIKIVTLCGGVPSRGQRASLENGAHIVVGTPGRIMDHLDRQTLDIAAVNTLVLDEADRMLDMGFFNDIVTVVKQCPPKRQTLLFSATYPSEIEKLATQFMKSPQMIKVESLHTNNLIEQRFYQIEEQDRLSSVAVLLNHFKPVSTLAFCNTKAKCRQLASMLQGQGFSALELHGDLEQRERDQVLVQFANRSASVLVATDVASRGLDIQQLEAVINVEVTPDPEVHIHRIGRTGRAGGSGLALSLVSMDEMGYVGRIEEYQKQSSQFFPIKALYSEAQEPLLAPMVTLLVFGGRKEKIRAGDILGALTNQDFGISLSREQVGKITVTEFSTFIAIERNIAKQALDKLNNGKVKGRSVKARIL